MYNSFFLANIKSYPFGQTSLTTEGIDQGYSLENMFGHFDDFSFRNFYNLNRIDNIESDKKFILLSLNMPLNYKIKLDFKTIQRINEDQDTWLVLVNLLEAEIDHTLLLKSVTKSRIRRDKVIVLTSCYSYNDMNNHGIQYVYADYWESFTRYHQRFLPNATDRKHVVTDVTKKFLCLNRNLKTHRIWFYFNLYKHQILNQSHTSYHLPLLDMKEYNTMTRSNYVVKYIPKALYKEYYQFLNKTYEGRTLDKLDINPINYNKSILHYYNDSLFSVITESDFRKVFLTEKTFKAIVHCHPFFIVGNPGHHQLLRDNGYYTFEDFFDCDQVIDFDTSSSFISKIYNTDLNEYKNKFNEKLIDKLYSNYENFHNRRISWNDIQNKLIQKTR